MSLKKPSERDDTLPNYPRCARGLTHAAGLAIVAMVLTGCAAKDRFDSLKNNPPGWLTPYRIDVGQGNYVTESLAAQLKKGMTREQVRTLLGTPLLVDPFRDDRWDYVFKLQRGDGRQDRRRFYVQFKNELLESWGGDPLPREGGEELLPSRPAR
jgi:outer membrane protein assembly factor BamE